MLEELSVRNLGVIDSLDLALGPGMTALTGETGAGKTLLVEAIELLTGARADPVMVRPGAEEAVVDGRFRLDGEERILSRVVAARGRSRAYLDGRMATGAQLEELASELVDLHGQHSHQSLLRPGGQRSALDAYARTDLSAWRSAREQVRSLEAALAGLGGDARVRARELDLVCHQLAEIEAAGLGDPQEDRRLEEEEELLAAAAQNRLRLEEAYELLAADDKASDLVGRAGAVLQSVPAQVVAALRRRLDSLAAELTDVGSELRTVAEGISEDPERLEEVRVRRLQLRDLVRKYGEDLSQVRAFAAEAARRRDELAAHENTVDRLERELATARQHLGQAEQAVRRARAEAAPRLAEEVAQRLRSLALPAARLEVELGPGGTGEPISFLFSANPGSPLQPLARVASGGELARAMLAARLVMSSGPPVMVFDEVDAGVGGEAALAVGQALAELAREHQVLVVTHLAQVAAFADQQVSVRKVVGEHSTRTLIQRLDPEERVVELSRMLGGRPDSASAQSHAAELLELARRSLAGA